MAMWVRPDKIRTHCTARPKSKILRSVVSTRFEFVIRQQFRDKIFGERFVPGLQPSGFSQPWCRGLPEVSRKEQRRSVSSEAGEGQVVGRTGPEFAQYLHRRFEVAVLQEKARQTCRRPDVARIVLECPPVEPIGLGPSPGIEHGASRQMSVARVNSRFHAVRRSTEPDRTIAQFLPGIQKPDASGLSRQLEVEGPSPQRLPLPTVRTVLTRSTVWCEMVQWMT